MKSLKDLLSNHPVAVFLRWLVIGQLALLLLVTVLLSPMTDPVKAGIYAAGQAVLILLAGAKAKYGQHLCFALVAITMRGIRSIGLVRPVHQGK